MVYGNLMFKFISILLSWTLQPAHVLKGEGSTTLKASTNGENWSQGGEISTGFMSYISQYKLKLSGSSGGHS